MKYAWMSNHSVLDELIKQRIHHMACSKWKKLDHHFKVWLRQLVILKYLQLEKCLGAREFVGA